MLKMNREMRGDKVCRQIQKKLEKRKNIAQIADEVEGDGRNQTIE